MIDFHTPELAANKPMTERQTKVVNAVIVLMILSYCVVILFATHNIYKYLYKKGLWRNFFVLSFYNLIFVICACRIAGEANYFRGNKNTITGKYKFLLGLQLNHIATYTKAILGIFQVGSIVELVLRLKQSIEHLKKEEYTDEKLENQNKIIYVCCTLIGLVLVVVVIVFSIYQP